MTSEEIKKAVRLFLDSGFNVSPEAIKFLSKSENPERIVKSVLKEIKHMKEKPLIILPELFESKEDWTKLFKSEDWDFAKVDTQYMTHGLHPYPARMIPQIARRLIQRYSEENDIVLDPFCGSGGVLVESRLLNRNSIGNDINPFAILLAKAKSTLIVPKQLNKLYQLSDRIESDILELRKGEKDVNLPNIPNLMHWFKEYVAKELTITLNHINEIKDIDLRTFAMVCFSQTMFKASNIDIKSSYFLRTLPKEKLRKHKPDVLTLFKHIVDSAVKKVRLYYTACEPYGSNWTQLLLGDTRQLPLPDESIDLIVTSPPYGEEKNTIGYVRWAKLVLYWFGYKPVTIRRVKKGTLGGIEAKFLSTTPSSLANKILKIVAEKNPARAKDALSFFQDYYTSLREIYRVLKKGRRCCIVVGNRSIARCRVDMKAVSVELARSVGFLHEKTHHRRFPYKAIPFVSGDVKTMTRESIIIFTK